MSMIAMIAAIKGADIEFEASEASTRAPVARKIGPASESPPTENATPAPDPVAKLLPWIPLVPLFGAVIAFNAYVVGWAVLVRT